MSKYRIGTDANQWIAYQVHDRTDKRTGKNERTPLGYYSTLPSAVRGLGERLQRDLWPKDGVDIDHLAEAVRDLSGGLREILEKALEGVRE